MFAELADPAMVARCLEGLAGIAAAQGLFPPCVRWLGAAETLRARVGQPLSQEDRPSYETALATASAALGEVAFAEAWEAGRSLPLTAAIAEAIALPDGPPAGRALPSPTPGETPGTPSLPPPRFDLTQREAEVLRLLTRRQTDKEIADALFVTRRTASHHVANVLAKLGAANRREAAALAARHGLA
jgi:DNA-binding CsgD family transcriptional regulator